MLPSTSNHFQRLQGSGTDSLENGLKGKVQQPSNDFSLKLTHRATSSISAQRRTSDSSMRTSVLTVSHHLPLKEINSFFSGEPALKKYSQVKQERSTRYHSSCFMIKRKHSPFLSLAEDGIYQHTKKYAPPCYSPGTPTNSCDHSKSFDIQSKTANECFAFAGQNATFSKSESVFTPSVQSQLSLEHIISFKDNIPSSCLSPQSLELEREITSSPENVYEKVALMDEDIECTQSQFTHRVSSLSKDINLYTPLSPLQQDECESNLFFSKLQAVLTDPDEEYKTLVIRSKR